MNTRDDLVRLAMLESSLVRELASLARTPGIDPRRWVEFACRCVLYTPTSEGPAPLYVMHDPTLLGGLRLAERWAGGEPVEAKELSAAWDAGRHLANTESSTMAPATAAQWSLLAAVEAAATAAIGNDAARVAELAILAAHYSRLARGTPSVRALGYQCELLRCLFAGMASPSSL